MINYVTIGATDHAKSLAFYDAVLAVLGYEREFDSGDWAGWRPKGGGQAVMICKPHDGQAARAGNGLMLGFGGETRQIVRDFHAAALANGGTDEGAPGERPYGDPPYYMAYVRDPTGNKLACACTQAE